MDFLPFIVSDNEAGNQIYSAVVRNPVDIRYKVNVEIDGLNDGLLLNEFCECKGHGYKKVRCKHIRELLRLMNSWGIDYREKNIPIQTADMVYAEAVHKI